MIYIKPDELAAVWLASNFKDKLRTMNQGVRVEVYDFAPDSKAALIATDGHRLHALHLQAGKVAEQAFTIPNDAIKQILALVKLERTQINKRCADLVEIGLVYDNVSEGLLISIIVWESEKKEASTAKSSLNAKTIDAHFPDYWRVMPDENQLEAANILGFNAEYMADFAQVAKLLGLPPHVVIQPTGDGEYKVMKIGIAGYETFTGLLMGVRI